MIKFILNSQNVETDLPKGTTVLDFARYHKNLNGTKIGCREGDCGACTILVGELSGETVKYRTQTSCLMHKELDIWHFAVERLKQKEPVALLVVAKSSGSSPGR